MGTLDELLSRTRGKGPVALDTMVFIYHLEDRAPFSDFTTALFQAGEEGRIKFCASVLSITEVLTGYRRMKDQIAENAFIRMLHEFSYFLRVVPVDFIIADGAAALRASYSIRTPDAIQIATAVSAGAVAYITNDRRLKRIKEISIWTLVDLVDRK